MRYFKCASSIYEIKWLVISIICVTELTASCVGCLRLHHSNRSQIQSLPWQVGQFSKSRSDPDLDPALPSIQFCGCFCALKHRNPCEREDVLCLDVGLQQPDVSAFIPQSCIWLLQGWAKSSLEKLSYDTSSISCLRSDDKGTRFLEEFCCFLSWPWLVSAGAQQHNKKSLWRVSFTSSEGLS